MPSVRATNRYTLAGAEIQTQARVKASMTHYGEGIFGSERTFVFPYAPVEVTYNNIARKYTEIERPGDFPLLDSVAPQLMKVQLQFRIADPASNGTLPIEGELDKLRLMALLPGPILIYNMESYLSRPIAPTVTFRGLKLAFFRMTDLGITVKRKNRDNRATQADVQMTLTEDRNPYIPAIALPPIDYSDTPVRKAGGAAATVGTGGTSVPARLTISQANAQPPR